MLGYSDIAHAHEKLDGAMNVSEVTVMEGAAEDTMRETFKNFGLDFEAVKRIGDDYANGSLTMLPMMLQLCGGDPVAAIHNMGVSAYVQGFLVALATVYEAGGNKA